MYSWDLDELKEKRIKNEFAISEAKRKQFEKTKLQKIRISARENSTLVDVLLNGSLTKWLFVMFMLVSTIAIFNSNSQNHWLDITYQDGQQISTFNENAYEVDYMSYSNIGEQMISNFQGITNVLDNANEVFLSIGTLINGVYTFFTSETVSNTVKDFAYFIAQLRYLPFRLIELIFD
jgi:hypothetical protein